MSFSERTRTPGLAGVAIGLVLLAAAINLRRDLLDAVRAAATDAAHDGVTFYVNSGWHFELRPEAIDSGCPDMYADPTHDPRMQP